MEENMHKIGLFLPTSLSLLSFTSAEDIGNSNQIFLNELFIKDGSGGGGGTDSSVVNPGTASVAFTNSGVNMTATISVTCVSSAPSTVWCDYGYYMDTATNNPLAFGLTSPGDCSTIGTFAVAFSCDISSADLVPQIVCWRSDDGLAFNLDTSIITGTVCPP